nr:hypothetical protein [Tanacetum cinerariifolium]
MGASTDSILSLTYEENFSNGRTHYYQSLLIGDEYRQYKGDMRGVRHLMRLEKEMMDDEGELTTTKLRNDILMFQQHHGESLLVIRGFYNLMLLVKVCTAAED